MKDSHVDEFIALTKCTRQMAREFLEKNNYELDYALNDFYDTCQNGFVVDMRPMAPELIALFEKYRSSEIDSSISTDGLVQLIEDLGLELEDPVTLCLAHTLQVKSLHDPISRNQFLDGLHSAFCASLEDVKSMLIEKESKLRNDADYLETIYNYTYGLILEPDHKTLHLKAAQEYWNLYFDPPTNTKFAIQPSKPFFKQWKAFLESQGTTTISRDVWQMFFKFIKQYPTLQALKQDYNEMDAWPLLIDEFYEYLEENGAL
ncbi:LAME_0G07470g1_1 [Lachancea meyersii CBS 8951]|uniref:Defective in cullin neddylation protein n=1 Tax=Lachancea meyersii CBS 8951 TaxID=1266667 RepID=A0A1G4K7X9_9SACH|nr:LAME_0G07470g1_1 [Lachancea meyersii CBS 8951]